MRAALSLPLVLGTAQLGLCYGIANATGQPDQDLATEIVRAAWEGGIREFDTAQAYGQSETVLGEALRRLGITDAAAVISKFDPRLDHLDADGLLRALDASLKRLGVERMEGLMLHREELLSVWNKGLDSIAARFVEEGKVERIGVSVYSPDKALDALRTDGIEMVQVPSNILDRRCKEAGVFELASKSGKRLYVRSVYLQGLLLMDPKAIPDGLSAARSAVERFEQVSRDLGLSRQELALLAMKSAFPEARFVLGAETPQQVHGNLRTWSRPAAPDLWDRVEKAVGRVDDWLLNPAMWPK